jgi:hypothetical protein
VAEKTRDVERSETVKKTESKEPTNNNPGTCEECNTPAVIVLSAHQPGEYDKAHRVPVPGSKAHPRCAAHLPSKPFTS